MAQISGIPLIASPGQLGQMMVRSGIIPEHLLKPGQDLNIVVLQSAKAGEKTQIRIAGKTLDAFLPGPAGAGQNIQVQVTKVSGQGTKLKMIDLRDTAPNLKVPGKIQQQVQMLAGIGGGKVTVQVDPHTQTIAIGGKTFSPGQLGLNQVLAPGRWVAQVQQRPEGMILTPMQMTLAGKIRQVAGEAVVSGEAKLIQAGLELAEQARDKPDVYGPGKQQMMGPAWMQLSDGTPISVTKQPMQDETKGSYSASLNLHGVELGAVSIHVHYSDTGTTINVQVDPQGHDALVNGAHILAGRLRALTGLPAQVRVTDRPTGDTSARPPEGHQYYG